MSAKICYICGEEILNRRAEHRDHIYPKSRGGTNAATNIRAVHADCNRIKGSLTIAELFLMAEKITIHLAKRITGSETPEPYRHPEDRPDRRFRAGITSEIEKFLDRHNEFLTTDFLGELKGVCSPRTLHRQLHKLVKEGKISWIRHGVYVVEKLTEKVRIPPEEGMESAPLILTP